VQVTNHSNHKFRIHYFFPNKTIPVSIAIGFYRSSNKFMPIYFYFPWGEKNDPQLP